VVFEEAGTGLIGFLISVTEKGLEGELDGDRYTSGSHYATLTLILDPSPRPSPTNEAAMTHKNVSPGGLPPLPTGIASFGAAVADGSLYIYGGHIGTKHQHSRDNVSASFLRLDLHSGRDWESLPMQTPLQGLALVAHHDQLYRIGGMHAANSADDPEELTSVDEFARFDSANRSWEILPCLPRGRSSHDAVVLGDKIYVVGGWELKDDVSTWHDTAMVIDLAADSLDWREFSAPFRRRALAAGTRDGKVFVLCGMDDSDKVSRRVDVFDPATETWSSGPDLPGEAMEGFGVSAWQTENDLFICGFSGILYRLNRTGDGWEAVGPLEEGRFFHRLLPLDERHLLAVGGASRSGHLASIERIARDNRD
jgi:N-acetylneuraminic acid mutarotase